MTYTTTMKSEDKILSEQEKIIKEQLESWITDIYKNIELEQKLEKAFENDKTHTRFFSES